MSRPYPPRRCWRCRKEKSAEAFAFDEVTGFHRRVCVECLAAEAAEKKARKKPRRRTWKRAGRWVRQCHACGLVKDLERDYYRSTSTPVGHPRDYQWDCKRCQTERIDEYQARLAREDEAFRAKRTAQRARWRENNRERERAVRRARHRLIRRDPVLGPKLRETERMARRLRRERRTGVPVTVQPLGTPRGPTPPNPVVSPLPARPLSMAVEAAIARRRLDDEHARVAICERIGVDVRQVYAWRTGEIEAVQFDVVDRVLTRLDLGWWECFTDPQDYELAREAFEGQVAA